MADQWQVPQLSLLTGNRMRFHIKLSICNRSYNPNHYFCRRLVRQVVFKWAASTAQWGKDNCHDLFQQTKGWKNNKAIIPLYIYSATWILFFSHLLLRITFYSNLEEKKTRWECEHFIKSFKNLCRCSIEPSDTCKHKILHTKFLLVTIKGICNKILTKCTFFDSIWIILTSMFYTNIWPAGNLKRGKERQRKCVGVSRRVEGVIREHDCIIHQGSPATQWLGTETKCHISRCNLLGSDGR